MASTTEGKVHNIDKPGDVAALVKLAKSSGDARAVVKKIVIGPSPKSDGDGWDEKSLQKNEKSLLALSEVDWAKFPNLTHLYLWSLPHLTAIKGLPEGLKCLDVRGCTGLVRLPKLPASLETLVTDGCTALVDCGANDTDIPALSDLSMARCPNLNGDFVAWILRNCQALEHIDLSGSSVPRELPMWAPAIRTAKFNGCGALKRLPDLGPDGWPAGLRRLELAGTSITAIPPLGPNLRYVNLASLKGEGLRGCELWPTDPKAPSPRPQTLYLHRCGLLVPPASEQGEDDEDNVAARFVGFYEDAALVGRGVARRCKILLVGNGDAGKTTFAHALVGLEPDHRQGSTHGIQLFRDEMPGTPPAVRHIWDFGGQDIYHNAHRIFMQAGSVFVVLWNPWEKPAAAGADGYADIHRPLRYWIDMIRHGCRDARIAVVCNPHAQEAGWDDSGAEAVAGAGRTPGEWRDRFLRETADLEKPVAFFVCNARKAGTQGDIGAWLGREINDLIAKQGTAVPTSWEIAQEMVENQRGTKGVPAEARLLWIRKDRFREQLARSIRETKGKESQEKFSALVAAVEDGTFELTDDRVDRTLRFLSDSGLVYWNPSAIGDRVILDQKWFLEGVYAVLARPMKPAATNRVFAVLSKNPVFTRELLADLVWARNDGSRRYSDEEQDVLLAFMETMGLCFPLVSAADAWTGRAAYLSVKHLRPTAESGVHLRFTSKYAASQPARRDRPVASLHVGLWERALAWLGRLFGRDGHYAADSVVIDRNKDGQAILVRCRINESGIGGSIEVQVCGPDPRDGKAEDGAAEKLANALADLCSEGTTKARIREVTSKLDSTTTRSDVPKVFLSYAWNPTTAEQRKLLGREEHVPMEHVVPIEQLHAELERRVPGLCRFDRADHDPRRHLENFLSEARSTDLFLVCHSYRYWRRPYCMYEVVSAFRSCVYEETRPRPADVFAFVKFSNCDVMSDVVRKEHANWWRTSGEAAVSTPLAELMSGDRLATAAEDFLRNDLGRLLGVTGNVCDHTLGERSAAAIADWILSERLKVGASPGRISADGDE
ncbi:MAG: hypothetical protein EBX39_07430 [Actinobacteria bacterium]|nr:hypothetical protein [Actinomycetota bacterium]